MKIIGLTGSVVGVFVIVLLLVFIYCCLIIGKDDRK